MKELILAAVLAVASPATAADPEALFQRGQFAAAADAARMQGTADGLALAARATLVVAAYEVAERDKVLMLIDDAEADADAALALAPGDPDAMLQKAIALGYRAKLKRSPSAAKEARRLMRAAVESDPRSALGWASLGGWHAEAVADLGGFLARTLLGARADSSIEAYERAVALDPANPIYRTFYAISLIGIDEGDEAKLRALLTPVANVRAEEGFKAMLRDRARLLLAALGDEEALEDAAEAAAPFARLE